MKIRVAVTVTGDGQAPIAIYRDALYSMTTAIAPLSSSSSVYLNTQRARFQVKRLRDMFDTAPRISRRPYNSRTHGDVFSFPARRHVSGTGQAEQNIDILR